MTSICWRRSITVPTVIPSRAQEKGESGGPVPTRIRAVPLSWWAIPAAQPDPDQPAGTMPSSSPSRGDRSLSQDRRASDDKVSLQFSVRDTGIGMTAEQQAQAFPGLLPGRHLDHPQYGGTGLGLTISKRLVEMMGGRIWVESEPGRGDHLQLYGDFGLGQEKRNSAFRPHSICGA